jgi:polar amino acid transport system substrate-binding protein
MFKQTLVRAFLALAAIAAFLPAAHADALDDILKSKVIKIAVPQDFPPFGSVGPDLKPQGYDIDMANAIAKALGVKLELVPVTSANRIPYLQTRKVDLIISSLGKNPEREKTIDFSAAYAPFFSGVFGPQAMAVSKPEDLAGKKVGVTRGAVEDIDLSKLVPPTAQLIRFEDNNATIQAFLAGQVELVATGNVVAAAILARNPKVRPEQKFVIKSSPCYVGLNKGEDRLRARVNEIIAATRGSGELDAISKKWLGYPLPADLPR